MKSKITKLKLIIILLVLIAIALAYYKFAYLKTVVSNNNPKAAITNYGNNDELVKSANIGDSAKDFKGTFSPNDGFSSIVEFALPAVVNVSAVKMVSTEEINGIPEDMLNPFLKEFFKQYAAPGKERKVGSLGSGFIVRSDGFVVTNYHVIKGAKEVKVIMQDKKTFPAVVYAVDSLTDLALLKVEATNLPSLKLGDSDNAKVGDWVIAIGNPFGLGGTVSAGIVSARNRDINVGLYDDFIQTDAAINRGNSGGPMLNTKGEVIGIDTAIFSTANGGSIGIGFAVPSNIIKDVIAQLITQKQVIRGWLGVQFQDVDEDTAKALGMKDTYGALVSDLPANSPAAKAGIKTGDVILEVNHVKLTDKRLLPRFIGKLKPNDKVDLKIFSNGQEKDVVVTLEKFPDDLLNQMNAGDDDEEGSKVNQINIDEVVLSELGIKVATVNDNVRKLFNLDAAVNGVIITAVEEGSVAEDKRLIAGLMIDTVNGKKVTTTDDIKNVLSDSSISVYLFLLRDPVQKIQFFVSIKKADLEQTKE